MSTRGVGGWGLQATTTFGRAHVVVVPLFLSSREKSGTTPVEKH